MKKGIVAFAFGVPSTITSNKVIGELASLSAKDSNASVYTQCDVTIDLGVAVEYTEETEGDPPPTLRIARGAVKWADEQGITELLIVAARPHLWRCERDLKRAVRERGLQIEVLTHPEITKLPNDTWYCPDSTQDRVRSPWAWNKRELILRFMPFVLYKRVAS